MKPTPTPGATRVIAYIRDTLYDDSLKKSAWLDLTEMIDRETGVADLLQMLAAARLQLEYLDAKFMPTGTTAQMVARIEALLAAHKQHRPKI